MAELPVSLAIMTKPVSPDSRSAELLIMLLQMKLSTKDSDVPLPRPGCTTRIYKFTTTTVTIKASNGLALTTLAKTSEKLNATLVTSLI